MIKNFSQFIESVQLNEKAGDSYSKGCVMAYLDDLKPEIEKLQSQIEADELYEEEGDRTFGLEDEPHVTVLYGIHSDKVDDDKVMELVKKMDWKQPISIGKPSLFENEKYDVLKLGANAEWLKEANRHLCESLPYSNDYPDYNAHVTVAYLKPGKGKEVVERLGDFGTEIVPNKMVYSLPNGEKKVQE
jgi:2'-5' RNA ligase